MAWVFLRRHPSPKPWRVQALPLLLVPAHLLWRYTTYGAWVPNTYFAKDPGLWPESGLRYLASFLVENGDWLWLVFAAVWAGREIVQRVHQGNLPASSDLIRLTVPAGALALHAGYYVLVIGGDHFEYRVLSHLVLLSFLTAPWLVAWWAPDLRWGVAAVVLLVVVSWPIPWTHWFHSHDLETRSETWKMVVPVAAHWPAPLRPLAEPWDRWQAWLVPRHVGMRHQEHKVLHRWQVRRWPPRNEGSRLRWEPWRPVMPLRMVGVPGWVFPEVAILDAFGLNDPIVARREPQATDPGERRMAHDRWPSPGYFECFEPNVEIAEDGGISVTPRRRPLTDARIRACQNAFR